MSNNRIKSKKWTMIFSAYDKIGKERLEANSWEDQQKNKYGILSICNKTHIGWKNSTNLVH